MTDTMLILLLSFLSLLGASSGSERSVCYYTNWSQYRNSQGKFLPENTDTSLCTHIIYAFGKVTNYEILPFEWNDPSTPWSKGMYERMIDMKATRPDLKVLLAVGGWNMGSGPFTQIVATPVTRSKFIGNAISFLRLHSFDGLDMDWEYPGSRGSPAADKQNFVSLMQELRREFEEEALRTGNPRLLLTGAFPAGKATIEAGYDLRALVPSMDFISLMTYDLHGAWDDVTGHNAPLHKHPQDQGADQYLNVEWVVQYYINAGVPAQMMNLGIPTYGRSFTLVNPGINGVGAPRKQGGQAGRVTREAGFLSYYEVCDMQKAGGQVYNIPSQNVRYLVLGDQWVGYDDVPSVKDKACLARKYNFGGIMFWSLDTDDFSGSTCGQGRYPLIRSAVQEFKNPSPTCGSSFVPNLVPTAPPAYTTQAPTVARPTAAPARPTNAPAPTRAPTSIDQAACAGIPDGIYADPSSCEHFITCASQTAHRSRCAPFLKYNPPIQSCDYPYNVVCNNGVRGGQTAAQNTLAPPAVVPTMAPTRNVVVTMAPTPPPSNNMCQSGEDFVRDPVDCTKFYQCTHGTAIRHTCPPPLVFNVQGRACDWRRNVPGC